MHKTTSFHHTPIMIPFNAMIKKYKPIHYKYFVICICLCYLEVGENCRSVISYKGKHNKHLNFENYYLFIMNIQTGTVVSSR